MQEQERCARLIRWTYVLDPLLTLSYAHLDARSPVNFAHGLFMHVDGLLKDGDDRLEASPPWTGNPRPRPGSGS